jgi:hypothetical protein
MSGLSHSYNRPWTMTSCRKSAGAQTNQFDVFSAKPPDGPVVLPLLAKLLRKRDYFFDRSAAILGRFPVFVGGLQLGVPGPAHRLSQEADARLGLLPIYG